MKRFYVVLSGMKGVLNQYGLPASNVTGSLSGKTDSGVHQGRVAAEIALRILDGEKPSDIPIKLPQAVQFNSQKGSAEAE
jgi:hypothetical protein